MKYTVEVHLTNGEVLHSDPIEEDGLVEVYDCIGVNPRFGASIQIPTDNYTGVAMVDSKRILYIKAKKVEDEE